MTAPAPQPDKDLDIIRDYIIMSSDWEIQQEMALDALHRIRFRPTPSPCTTPELCSLLNEAKHKGSTPSPQPTDDAIPFGDWLSINNAKVRNATLNDAIKAIRCQTMTPPRQQEYIITENQLEALAAGCQNDYGDRCRGVDESFIETIRSRPAPSPQIKMCFGTHDGRWDTCVACSINFECIEKQKLTDNEQKQHDATIRNATLDAIIEFTKGNSETIEADDGTLEDAVFLGELLAKIESLRTPKEPKRSHDLTQLQAKSDQAEPVKVPQYERD